MFEDRGVVCRCINQAELEYLLQPWYESVSLLSFLQPVEQMLPFIGLTALQNIVTGEQFNSIMMSSLHIQLFN